MKYLKLFESVLPSNKPKMEKIFNEIKELEYILNDHGIRITPYFKSEIFSRDLPSDYKKQEFYKNVENTYSINLFFHDSDYIKKIKYVEFKTRCNGIFWFYNNLLQSDHFGEYFDRIEEICKNNGYIATVMDSTKSLDSKIYIRIIDEERKKYYKSSDEPLKTL